MRRFKSGFTLVELLVVITIIGLLVGLLIPAVNMVRERGRQATCLNSQKQIGLAILGYETAKGLPGVMNQMTISSGTQTAAPGGTATIEYSWAEAIFPNLEHADLWQQLLSPSTTAALTTIRVSTLICPDDPLMADPTSPYAQMLLSYGVNDQFFVDNRGNALNGGVPPPVGRSAGNTLSSPVARAVVSNLKTRPYAGYPHGQSVTTTQTVMLGERTFPDTTYPPGKLPRQWGDPGTANAPTLQPWSKLTARQFWQVLAFPYPALPTPTPAPSISPQFMGSTHGATAGRTGTVVIVTYFDGHGAILPSDTPFP